MRISGYIQSNVDLKYIKDIIMRVPLCVLLLCISSGIVHAEAQQSVSANETNKVVPKEERYKHTAYIRPQGVLEKSEEFNDRKRSIQEDANKQAKQLQDTAQKLSDDKQSLQNEMRELQNGSKSKFKSAESRQSQISELSEQQAELEKQENNLKYDYQRVQEKYKREEQNLQMEMWDKMQEAAKVVGQEQGWGAIDMASMYVAPSLDVTDDVAQAMNKSYRERKQTKKQAASQTEQEAAQKTQAA